LAKIECYPPTPTTVELSKERPVKKDDIEKLVKDRMEAKMIRDTDILAKCGKFKTAELARQANLYPYFSTLQDYRGPVAVIDGKPRIIMGSGNYLGLSIHPDVKQASMRAIEKYGTSASGSRFLLGTFGLHEELERKLAEFVKKEAALIFSSGYQANLGVISSLVGSGEHVIMDKHVHMSIQDGAKLSEGNILKFEHNNAHDLTEKLKPIKSAPKLIAVDGIYSMEGDIAKLPEIISAAEKYKSRIMVDDVHSLGVLGPQGRGTAAHFNLTEKVDIIMGTFSKSLASSGGFVASSKEVIDFIKHFASSMMFSASLPPAILAAVLESLRIMQEENEWREKLLANVKIFRTGLKQLGFDTGNSESQIIPVIIGEDMPTMMCWKTLFDAGVYTDCVLYPAVPKGRSLLRTSTTALHTKEHINTVLDAFEKVGRNLKIIK
jgi:8-amino-7-oxononanoate synthase